MLRKVRKPDDNQRMEDVDCILSAEKIEASLPGLFRRALKNIRRKKLNPNNVFSINQKSGTECFLITKYFTLSGLWILGVV